LKVPVKALGLAALLGSGLTFGLWAAAQQQSGVPDAPAPQIGGTLPGAKGPITPGSGANAPENGPTSSSDGVQQSAPQQEAAPPQQAAPTPPPPPQPDNFQTTPPEMSSTGIPTIRLEVNYVEVPVIVRDSKGNPVAGLDWRDFQVLENNVRQHISTFSTDPAALSVAFVIDQTLPSPVMEKVNTSLGAIQGALTPYDEAAVFTYTNGAREWTTFTGGQSTRLPAVLAMAQAVGTDPQVPFTGGPFGGCAIVTNGNCADPNVQIGGSTGNSDNTIRIPKEIHTLNDAILQAAKELSTRPKERRRVIFVVSDGKEYGSRASWKEVVRYLQTNKITVYATLVGDSARWGEGWLNRYHLPFEMYDNILYKYTIATGGELDSAGGVQGMEKSYARVAAMARNAYTLGYLSHESIFDSKFRSIDVRVDRPNLVITAKKGYYPSGQDYR
jgi:VWFA-related protein